MPKVISILKSEKYWPFIFLFLLVVIFFYPFFIKGLIPLPGDILLGAYYPWKFFSWGIFNPPYPYKIFEIADSVNFYYPVKLEIIRQFTNLHLPIWNSLILNGTPLLGDGHSGAVYPLNLLFFIGNFNFGWALFVAIQPFLASSFLYSYLKHKKLSVIPSLMGSISFGFGSYFINQVELVNVMHTAMWLPLILLGIDLLHERKKQGTVILLISSVMMFLAGFLQFFIYGVLLGILYFFFSGKLDRTKMTSVILISILFLSITAVQLLPILQFLPHTIRWHGIGLEVPITEYLLNPKLLLTLLSPDYFGHPATQNWTGGYAYYEFVAYVGPFLLPLLYFSIKSEQKIKSFFWSVLAVVLIFTLRSPLTLTIYGSHIPLISSLTPSRALILFSLAASILIAIGLEEFSRKNKKEKIIPFIVLSLLILILFLASANRHLIIPLILAVLAAFSLSLYTDSKKQILIILFLSTGALFIQAHKYLSFIPASLIYPSTKSINYLKNNLEGYRYLSVDSETFPVNSNMVFNLPTANGYHPVQNFDYHQTASRLQFEDSKTSFGRTIFLTRLNKKTLDFSGTKLIISHKEIDNPVSLSLIKKVYSDGDTLIYEVSTPSGKPVLPEIYFLQKKMADIGLVITSIGMAATLIFLRKK